MQLVLLISMETQTNGSVSLALTIVILAIFTEDRMEVAQLATHQTTE